MLTNTTSTTVSTEIWEMLETVEMIVAWKHQFEGMSTYFEVWRYVASELRNKNQQLYQNLETLISARKAFIFTNYGINLH